MGSPPSNSDYQRFLIYLYIYILSFQTGDSCSLYHLSLSAVRLGTPHPIHTHFVSLSHSIGLKSLDFAQNPKISISIQPSVQFWKRMVSHLEAHVGCVKCSSNNLRILNCLTDKYICIQKRLLFRECTFFIYSMILIGFSRNIMVEFLFSYFMLWWNGTWVVNNVSRPKTKGIFPNRDVEMFSDEAEHQVGVWVVEIDPSEVDRIREQVPSSG